MAVMPPEPVISTISYISMISVQRSARGIGSPGLSFMIFICWFTPSSAACPDLCLLFRKERILTFRWRSLAFSLIVAQVFSPKNSFLMLSGRGILRRVSSFWA